MANFGADIIQNKTALMQNENQNRRQMLLQLAAQYQDQKQFDKTLAHKAANPDLTMDEQSLRDVQAYQAGNKDPNILARLKARAAMEGNKTEYSQDALGNLVPRTTANPFAQLLNANDVGGSAQVPAVDAGQPVSAPMSKREQLLSMPVQDETMQPDQFRNMVLNGGDALPDAKYMTLDDTGISDAGLATNEPSALPPASDAYSQSPVGQKDVGAANVDVAKQLTIKKGESALKKDESQPVEKNKILSGRAKLQSVMKDVLDAKNLITPFSTGYGASLQALPESEARSLANTLSKLKSKSALNALSELKNLSASGASGLGSTSFQEFSALENSVANLDQFTSPAMLEKELNNIEGFFLKNQDMLENYYKENFGELPKSEQNSYSTLQEAEAANLPKGTILMIGGRRAVVE